VASCCLFAARECPIRWRTRRRCRFPGRGLGRAAADRCTFVAQCCMNEPPKRVSRNAASRAKSEPVRKRAKGAWPDDIDTADRLGPPGLSGYRSSGRGAAAISARVGYAPMPAPGRASSGPTVSPGWRHGVGFERQPRSRRGPFSPSVPPASHSDFRSLLPLYPKKSLSFR